MKQSSRAVPSETTGKGMRLTRRSFLIATAQATVGALLPAFVSAKDYPPLPVSFLHTHTGEKMTIDYSFETYTGSVKRAVEYFLRDFRTGEVHPIDPRLLDVLYAIQYWQKHNGCYEVISGYRSPRTNEFLRKRSSGVAKRSYHLEGRAIDIRLSTLSTRTLARLAMKYNDGGVGYYPKSDFIHIDTGRRRSWESS